MKKPREKQHPLNPGEAHVLKMSAERLSEAAAKQALYGIVNILTTKITLSLRMFEEIMDDATKLTQHKKQVGTSSVEYALLVVGVAAACLLAVGLLGDAVRALFQTAADLFTSF